MFTIAKQTAALLDAHYSAACKNLSAIPGISSGPMGLTPDNVKARPDYRIAKAAFDKAFAKMRAFNAVYVKQYKKELAAERKARRDALCVG